MKNCKYHKWVGIVLAVVILGCNRSDDNVINDQNVLGEHSITRNVSIAQLNDDGVDYMVEKADLISHLEWTVNRDNDDVEMYYTLSEIKVETGKFPYLIAKFHNTIGKSHLIGIRLEKSEAGVFVLPRVTKKHACTPKPTCKGCDFKYDKPNDADKEIIGCTCENSTDELKCKHSVSVEDGGIKTTCTSYDCKFCDIVKVDGSWTCPCKSDKDDSCQKSVEQI